MAIFVGQIMVNNGPHWGTLCSQPNYLLKMVSPHFCGDILQRFRLVKPLYQIGRNRGTTNQRGILYSQSTISMGKKWFWGPLNPYDHMGMAQKAQCWLDASKIDMTRNLRVFLVPHFFLSIEWREWADSEMGMGWGIWGDEQPQWFWCEQTLGDAWHVNLRGESKFLSSDFFVPMSCSRFLFVWVNPDFSWCFHIFLGDFHQFHFNVNPGWD
jgi:hypothetical protein